MNLVSHDIAQEMINILSTKTELYKISYEKVASLLDNDAPDRYIICIPHLTYITIENIDRFIRMIKRDVEGVEVEPIVIDSIGNTSFDYMLTMSQEDSDGYRIIKVFGFMCIPSESGYAVGYLTYERNIELTVIELSDGLIKKFEFEEYVKFCTAETMLKLLEKKMTTKTT